MPFALQIHFQMRPGSKLSEVVREATASGSERLCAAGKKDQRDREDRVGEETVSDRCAASENGIDGPKEHLVGRDDRRMKAWLCSAVSTPAATNQTAILEGPWFPDGRHLFVAANAKPGTCGEKGTKQLILPISFCARAARPGVIDCVSRRHPKVRDFVRSMSIR